MDDDVAAMEKIDRLALELGKAIIDASVSVEGARQLYCQTNKLLYRRFCLGLFAPAFNERARKHKQQVAAREVQTAFHARQVLELQLGQLGIDHKPIFEARSKGGD